MASSPSGPTLRTLRLSAHSAANCQKSISTGVSVPRPPFVASSVRASAIDAPKATPANVPSFRPTIRELVNVPCAASFASSTGG